MIESGRLPIRHRGFISCMAGLALAVVLGACAEGGSHAHEPPSVRPVAEFERTERVVVRYPFDLPLEFLALLSHKVRVTTIVTDASLEQRVRGYYRTAGADTSNCDFLRSATDSHWTRDYVPFFVADLPSDAEEDRPAELLVRAADFTYNRPRPLDNRFPAVLAEHLHMPLCSTPLVHTGGNYLVDGYGSALSSDLVRSENQHLTESRFDDIMRRFLGITTYHVLPDPVGGIRHINTWAKVLAVDKVMVRAVGVDHALYEGLEAVVRYLSEQTSANGTPYKIHRVRAPAGEPYANAIIVNDTVYVPLIGSPRDEQALAAYSRAMPGYEVVGVWGRWLPDDALACRTAGIPDRLMVSIRHVPLSGDVPEREGGWEIVADIATYGGGRLDSDAVSLYYRVHDGPYIRQILHRAGTYRYAAVLPLLPAGTRVSYYLEAADTSGKKEWHPLIGLKGPHVFRVAAH